MKNSGTVLALGEDIEESLGEVRHCIEKAEGIAGLEECSPQLDTALIELGVVRTNYQEALRRRDCEKFARVRDAFEMLKSRIEPCIRIVLTSRSTTGD